MTIDECKYFLREFILLGSLIFRFYAFSRRLIEGGLFVGMSTK